jgi:hypothetical protein
MTEVKLLLLLLHPLQVLPIKQLIIPLLITKLFIVLES